MNSSDTSIIFIVDPPKLVPEGIILISSIRRHLGDVDVVCYVPRHKQKLLPPQFVSFAACHGVQIDYIDPDDRFSPVYPHGNKLLAAMQPRATAKTLFLDTDTVIWDGFDIDSLITEGRLSAAPEGRRTWGKPKFGEDWWAIYRKFGHELSEAQVKFARTGKLSPPYFNAGVVGFPNHVEGSELNFGKLWLETAIAIDQDDTIPKRRPWVDQISLPIAMTLAGWTFEALSIEWNLSLSRHSNDPAKEIEEMDSKEPYILHYHDLEFLKDTRYDGYLDSLVSEYTIFSDFAEMMSPVSERSQRKIDLEEKLRCFQNTAKGERTPEMRVDFVADKKARMAMVNQDPSAMFNSWPMDITRKMDQWDVL